MGKNVMLAGPLIVRLLIIILKLKNIPNKLDIFSVVRLGLCISPVGALDGSRGIYPTEESINYSFVTYVTR